MSEPTFVIIGASLAGAKAAETLRDEGFTGRVVLIGEEEERPYERPPLSKGHLQGKDPRDKAFVHDADWYVKNEVDLRLGVRAIGLDRAAKTVALDVGEPVRYDKLLLATGSRVRRLDTPGVDARGVHYLRTIVDSDTVLGGLRAGSHAVVVGAGWIGLETAAAAKAHGATATVVEADTLPLRRVLGDEVAQIFADVHRANGVEFRFGSGVSEFTTDADGKLTAVVLADSSVVPADLAVVGVGIRPAVELAEVAGLEVADGVVTDESLRTSDPDIFAAGDVASSYNPLVGKHIRVEHWANALNGGKTAAKAMLGQAVVYDRVPYFYSDQFQLGMEYSGYVEPGGYDRVVFRGGTSVSDGFIAFWTSGGRVLAGMNVNVWDVTGDIQKLVRAGYGGSTVDLDRLGDPSVPLDSLV